MDTHEAQEFARTASMLWGFFARIFLRPDQELASEVKAGNLSVSIAKITSENMPESFSCALEGTRQFEASLRDTDCAEIRLLLEVEYNRLFVGPLALPVPPYESFYRSDGGAFGRGRLRTQDEKDVQALYRRYGFTLPDVFVELPDHISVELEFLAGLTDLEAQAWDEGDIKRAGELQDAQNDFVSRHLGSWLGSFTEKLCDAAKLPFYVNAALLLRDSLALLFVDDADTLKYIEKR